MVFKIVTLPTQPYPGHQVGTSNQVADALSMSPVSQDRVLHIEVEGSGTTMGNPREMTLSY